MRVAHGHIHRAPRAILLDGVIGVFGVFVLTVFSAVIGVKQRVPGGVDQELGDILTLPQRGGIVDGQRVIPARFALGDAQAVLAAVGQYQRVLLRCPVGRSHGVPRMRSGAQVKHLLRHGRVRQRAGQGKGEQQQNKQA